jgi:hypothetical protein
MEGLRRRLNYANVVATMALVVAVAGGSTAIAISKGKNKGVPVRVTKSSDITKTGTIKAGHVGGADLADASVTTQRLADGSVTAAKLAGIDRVIANGTEIVTASCPPGERLLSGGGLAPGLQNSSPSGQQVGGWEVAGAATKPVTAVALCLK